MTLSDSALGPSATVSLDSRNSMPDGRRVVLRQQFLRHGESCEESQGFGRKLRQRYHVAAVQWGSHLAPNSLNCALVGSSARP